MSNGMTPPQMMAGGMGAGFPPMSPQGGFPPMSPQQGMMPPMSPLMGMPPHMMGMMGGSPNLQRSYSAPQFQSTPNNSNLPPRFQDGKNDHFKLFMSPPVYHYASISIYLSAWT